MIHTDYDLDALTVLLREDCLIQRYRPLISCREQLLSGLRRLGCRTKCDAARLSDDALRQSGLPDDGMIRLFRQFLDLYEPGPQKLRELAKLCVDPAEQEAYRELYHLPGVRQVRAALYLRSGYRSLAALADADADEVIRRTAAVIDRDSLPCAVPLPKEVRTHIAVAKAFTGKTDGE